MPEMDNIYDYICLKNDVFIKNQQRDDVSLSLEEKKRIVKELFDKNPSNFVYRYGKHLTEEQLNMISDEICRSGNENVIKQINDLISERNSKKNEDVIVKNRRMAAVEKLLNEKKYFSFYEMQSRHPYLFEKYIERHMDPKEKIDFKQKCNAQNYVKTNWSSYLMEQIRQGEMRQRFLDEETFEEGEDEPEDGKDDDEDSRDGIGNDKDIRKKERLMKEFMFIMIQNFIDGKDNEFFDYSLVDNNDFYDISKEYERDLEDKYFDED